MQTKKFTICGSRLIPTCCGNISHSQGNYLTRLEGAFKLVSLRMFNMAGISSNETNIFVILVINQLDAKILVL